MRRLYGVALNTIGNYFYGSFFFVNICYKYNSYLRPNILGYRLMLFNFCVFFA